MTTDRRPHAGYEQQSRLEKSRKIQQLIERRRPLAGADLLEIGCGSGWMANAWSKEVGSSGSVAAVDRYDQRRVTDGFTFQQVDGTAQPFEDDSFDIVISNHVIEHVGELADQQEHLAEIRRVMRPDGVLYLAVPNKWRVIEPHFKLPLLSWLPSKLGDRYVRATGKGEWYDVVPPSHRTMKFLLDDGGFDWEDVTLESLQVMQETETTTLAERAASAMPRPVLQAGYWFIPSMIYLATIS